jgi:hypothetical protein
VEVCFVAAHPNAIPELSRERVDQDAPPLAIELPHPAQMAGEMPLADEVGEDRRVQGRGKNVHRLPDGDERSHEVFGDDDVAEAESREQNLAERPDVDDAGIPIEALERCDGEALEAILAVVVILDNPRSGPPGPVEELEPSDAVMVTPSGYWWT